jgi:valyl-tRNA synthetase
MSMPGAYNPSTLESYWYEQWQQHGFFHSEPDERTPYTIVMPPPNVTGVLHMGHLLNNTLQDVLIRRARLLGYNACWVPGTDHASIATEAKVVNMLKEKGIDKSSLTREEFLAYAWEWKANYGGIILEQLKRIGASCDWNRTRFTMEDELYRSVIKVFVDLYRKGYIYKGVQMVNWDVQAQTAISDEEVNYREVTSTLYHVQYPLKNREQTLTIATTRPETILADTAVCVNPEDERFQHLIGQTVIIPLVNREVPVIADEHVDPEFGTGALKITPAHDINDYRIGQRHELPVIDMLNFDGTLSNEAEVFIGQDRFEARESVAKALQEQGCLVKTETLTNKVGYSERTDTVIEPKLSDQWFCRMPELARPALDSVVDDTISFCPEKFKNSYRQWMENIQDWCISRQLWWGHRIPVYYTPDGNFVVAETPEEALKLARKQSGNPELQADDLTQEADVLDTWFSSWLWPISVFNGINEPDNAEKQYYYPTDVLVTAPDIIFFWVARMIMAGYEYEDQRPFGKVYFNGMVRDKDGRKMSKSLGNSPDILRLIDDYGADGTRFGVLISSPAGNDLLFDEKLCEQGRNFANKLWNAMKLVKSWSVNDKIGKQPDEEVQQRHQQSIALFRSRLYATFDRLEANYERFRIADNLTQLYRLIWDEFCSHYLEWVKPGKQEVIDPETYEATVAFFEELLKLLHPYMPFVTEEIWHQLRERAADEYLIIARYAEAKSYDPATYQQFDHLTEVLAAVRNFKARQGLKPTEAVGLQVSAADPAFYQHYEAIIKQAAVVRELTVVDAITDTQQTVMVNKDQLQFQAEEAVDVEAQLQQLEDEKAYNENFLQSVNKKLSNEGFINNAKPEVVEKERQKKQDAEEKIRKLQASIERLQNLRKEQS